MIITSARVDLGMIYTRMGKKQEANAAFRKAININPNMKNVINQLIKQKPAWLSRVSSIPSLARAKYSKQRNSSNYESLSWARVRELCGNSQYVMTDFCSWFRLHNLILLVNYERVDMRKMGHWLRDIASFQTRENHDRSRTNHDV